ncbi:MAG: DUF2808 domain-containing protein [Cyanobacteria bacterium P01_F01_bin.143]
MLKPFNIKYKVISSSIAILTAAILGNTIASSFAIAQSTTVETQTTEYIRRVAFSKAPRLLDIYSTFNSVRMRGATYYFDVTIPQDAGAPLQKVAIELRQGQEDIDYKLEKTVAYLGTHGRKGEEVAVETVSLEESTGIITVEFVEPLSPDTTFTVGLKPKRNPDYDGVYVFGVTVFPQGENPYGLYLGSRNLNFYSGYDGLSGY